MSARTEWRAGRGTGISRSSGIKVDNEIVKFSDGPRPGSGYERTGAASVHGTRSEPLDPQDPGGGEPRHRGRPLGQQPRGHPRPPARSPCWARRRASCCPSSRRSAWRRPSCATAAEEAVAALPKAYGGESRVGRDLTGADRPGRRGPAGAPRRVPLHRAPAARPGRHRRRRPATTCSPPWPRCGAATASPARTPRTSTRRSRSTAATSPRRPARARSIRSSAATTRSAASSRCCPAAPRTTRCSSASPAWARPPSSRAWPAASSRATCPRA